MAGGTDLGRQAKQEALIKHAGKEQAGKEAFQASRQRGNILSEQEKRH